MNEKIHNFIKLYNDSIEENLSEVTKELQEAGIDTDALKKNLLQKIKKAEADLNIEKGRKFKETYLDAIGRNSGENDIQNPQGKSGLRLAARNADENEGVENTGDDELKLKLIEKIKKENFDNGAG